MVEMFKKKPCIGKPYENSAFYKNNSLICNVSPRYSGINLSRSIKDWPEDERPREKLLKEGEHTLSNTELLAILLRSGTKGQSAVDLARSILLRFKTLRKMSHLDPARWKEIKGLGPAKITQLRAALEIGRRFGEEKIKEKSPKIQSSGDIAKILMPRMRDLKKEIFKILLLDSQNRIIEIIETEEGTVNQANPIIREVYHKALQHFAASIVCVHNHPSGSPQPSGEDKEFTRNLIQAGKVLAIKALDHIIIGDDEYFSFLDEGLM